MKVTDVSLDKKAQANFRERFLLLVDQSGTGCWPWKGPRHSSGRGRYLWRTEDGGDGKYVMASRVSYYLATGELPAYLRSLCGNRLCCKASHYWRKPAERWKPKPRRATRGRVRQLPDSEIRRIRLLATLSHDEDEIGQQFGLTARQVAQIAMGKVRPEAGGRIRSSRFKGIRQYHREFEQELLLMMRPHEQVPHFPVHPVPQVARIPSNPATSCLVPPGRPFPSMSYGQIHGRRLPRSGRC